MFHVKSDAVVQHLMVRWVVTSGISKVNEVLGSVSGADKVFNASTLLSYEKTKIIHFRKEVNLGFYFYKIYSRPFSMTYTILNEEERLPQFTSSVGSLTSHWHFFFTLTLIVAVSAKLKELLISPSSIYRISNSFFSSTISVQSALIRSSRKYSLHASILCREICKIKEGYSLLSKDG